jgi:uncharacterized protein YyaL (SSP411 family)
MDVLQAMTDVFKNKRGEVEQQAETLVQHLRQSSGFTAAKSFDPEKGESFYTTDNCREIADNILSSADRQEGGFGKAPKFLQTPSISYLLSYAHLAGNEPSLEHAWLTLTKMLNGGIYDQLGGGISRYSTDNEWLVPHFEKMLYDNALFVSVLSDAFQLTGEARFKQGITETMDFILEEMKDPDGGYYTAIDADSEGVEGRFYVWTKDEVHRALGPDATLFCDYYNITEEGNWEGTNILNIQQDKTVLTKRYELSAGNFNEIIQRSRKTLLSLREKRIPPAIDDKILLNCNALLLSALCKAFAATGEEKYRVFAEDLSRFIDEKFSYPEENGMLYHSYKKGEAKHPAFLDDYAYLAEGLILLQEITSNQSYLNRAMELVNYVTGQFGDEGSAFFYYSDSRQSDILVRKVELYDGATPSANAVMARNLLYLGIVFEQSSWVERGNKMQFAINDAIQKYPTSFGVWACNYLNQAFGINEITVTGEGFEAVLTEILRNFIPNKIILSSNSDNYVKFPMLKNKLNFGEPKIYLCRNAVCYPPLTSVNKLVGDIKNLSTK